MNEFDTEDGKPVVVGDEFAERGCGEWLVGKVTRVTKTQAVVNVVLESGGTYDFRFWLRDFQKVGKSYSMYSLVRRVDDNFRKMQEERKRQYENRRLNQELEDAVRMTDPAQKLGADTVRELIAKLLEQNPTGEIASSKPQGNEQ